MPIKRIIAGILLTMILKPVIAEPPYEVMKSCQKGTPISPAIKMTVLNSTSGYSPQSPSGCENRYEIKYKERVLGSIECNDDLYVYSAQRKMKAADATDMTNDPKLQPSFFYSDISVWSKIDDGQNSYLCIAGPLSQASNINRMQGVKKWIRPHSHNASISCIGSRNFTILQSSFCATSYITNNIHIFLVQIAVL